MQMRFLGRTGERLPRVRRGQVLVTAALVIPVIALIGGLGFTQVRKGIVATELQQSCDHIARHAAQTLRAAAPSSTELNNRANAAYFDNQVSGIAPGIVAARGGRWSFETNSLVPLVYPQFGDSIEITLRHEIPTADLMPMHVTGSGTWPVQRTAIATVVRKVVTATIPARGNLWLSGMPDNTVCDNLRPDNAYWSDNNGTSGAPQDRPYTVTLSTLNIVPGDIIGFEPVRGTASWNWSEADALNGAEGDRSHRVTHGSNIDFNDAANLQRYPANENAPQNGIANVKAPMGSVVGVFLGSAAPNTTAAPGTVFDFTTSSARNYNRVTPALKQPFFIGDGINNNGKRQQIVVPAGATRLVLGMMDCWRWADNTGSFPCTIVEFGPAVLMR